MAREKRSLFEWLTGSAGTDDEFSFDDLESGTTFSRDAGSERHLIPTHPAGEKPVPATPEDIEGELAVDVYQTPTHIVIRAMMAGVRPDDVDVSITRDMVTIRGKRESLSESSTGDYFFRELYWGSFSRTIVLPQEVEIEGAEASEKQGLLTIKLPKLDKGKQAKLKVRAN